MKWQILDAEDQFNQKLADLITSMSDIVVCIIDVRQFATIAQLGTVMTEANGLIEKAVNFFNEHKKRGTLGKYFI